MKNTYWIGKGKYQDLADKLNELVPTTGSVPNLKENRALEKFRKASNCYYDLFNNGLCNRAAEFRSIFGFAGTYIAKKGLSYCQKLEDKMDEIILDASKEQNIN